MSQEYRPIKNERTRDPASTDLLVQMSIEIHGTHRLSFTEFDNVTDFTLVQ